MSPGLFITFEGIEGSGKSTQLNLTRDWFAGRGRAVETTREPGGTGLGLALRNHLLDPAHEAASPTAELFLYLADRAQNVARRIRPALEAGKVVLCDRHADATLVYQGALRGFGLERARELNRLATGGLTPDLTLLFDLPVEEGLARVALRPRRAGEALNRMDVEPLDFHRQVRRAYLDLARLEPQRFLVIDASGSEPEVSSRVVAGLEARLAGRL